MSKLIEHINQITEFGIAPKVKIDNKIDILKKTLLGIYYEYTKMTSIYDKSEYDDEPNFDYKMIRKNVEQNFPELGLYYSIFDSHKLDSDADVVTEDAIDDLTDIIKDLLAIKWRFENTSEIDGIWHFELS